MPNEVLLNGFIIPIVSWVQRHDAAPPALLNDLSHCLREWQNGLAWQKAELVEDLEDVVSRARALLPLKESLYYSEPFYTLAKADLITVGMLLLPSIIRLYRNKDPQHPYADYLEICQQLAGPLPFDQLPTEEVRGHLLVHQARD